MDKLLAAIEALLTLLEERNRNDPEAQLSIREDRAIETVRDAIDTYLDDATKP